MIMAALPAVSAILSLAPSGAPAPTVTIKVDQPRIGMGRALVVAAVARQANGKPAAGWEMLPYVNDRRWGPHEFADAAGRALFRIPLPTPGKAAIRVQARPKPGEPDDYWIWSNRQNVPEAIYLQRVFRLDQPARRGALWLAVDDGAIAYLNGAKVGEKVGWSNNAAIALDPALFLVGQNVLSVDATNGGGACGLLVRLSADTAAGRTEVVTNTEWRVFDSKPEGWPSRVGAGGEAATACGRADAGATMPRPWPSIAAAQRIAGTPLPSDAAVSAPVNVTVLRRALHRPPTDPDRLVAMQWEQWFTPLNAFWQTAQAVPLMGFYDARMPEVARQHLIWFIESGVDCVIADWSNNIWFAREWAPGAGVAELIDATRVMLDEMARMRAEGYAVPRMSLLTGVGHLRPEGPVVVNRQLAYIWDALVREPRYKGLWQEFDGKPLVLSLDLGASYLKEGFKLDDRFTIRFMGVQQDVSKTDDLGLWSWMDSQTPEPTMRDGRAEGMTVSVGCFGAAGWLGKDARGRRNGATLVEDWRAALKHRPRFLQVHQFQEFAGQLEGKPVAQPNVYVDSYSAELSDDIEPTSLTTLAYRGEGGWGFYYLNLLRALVDLYRRPVPTTTVLTISRPLNRQVVTGEALTVEWLWVGKRPRSFRVLLDGKPVAATVAEKAAVSLRGLRPGAHTLRVVAVGSQARYRLSWTEDALPLTRPEPAASEIRFRLGDGKGGGR
ncbi:MAG: hypothetical protein NT029_12645 [Armatimonadetes bacterium]|nr:hypothetical protein [Armatimonadota bacterium]